MKKISIMGILILVLVLVGCASTPKGEPTPFEGRWNMLLREDAPQGVYFSLIFKGNSFTLEYAIPDENGNIQIDRVRWMFIYTDTEILYDTTLRGAANSAIYKYTYTLDLEAGRLTTTEYYRPFFIVGGGYQDWEEVENRTFYWVRQE